MQFIQKETVALQATLLAVLNMLVVLGALHLADVQLGAVNVAVAAILGLFVRNAVMPYKVDPTPAAVAPATNVPATK